MSFYRLGTDEELARADEAIAVLAGQTRDAAESMSKERSLQLAELLNGTSALLHQRALEMLREEPEWRTSRRERKRYREALGEALAAAEPVAPVPSFGRRALRAVFYFGGAVATTAGLHTVIAGAKSLPRQKAANPSLESELRFYAAFYVAYGLVALRVAPRAHRDTAGVRGLAGALFLAGVARAGGWLAAGRPHELQVALLAIELAAPPPIVAWQARLASGN
jgi:hypothetical protein